MEIEENEFSKNQKQNKPSNQQSNQQSNNNTNNNKIQQAPKIVLDPKAEEMLKKFEKKIPIKEYTFNDEILYIPTRYKPGEIIGIGAYGIIISAIDTLNNNQVVAIKKLKRISDIIDLKRIAREILIMKYCQHENIIPLLDVIIHLNKDEQTK